MATEADLIQKFKDLNIPVGADFEELIHVAFAGANLADLVSKNKTNALTAFTIANNANITANSAKSKSDNNEKAITDLRKGLATKADTSSIDPSVLAKSTLTDDDDVLTLDPGTYYTWGVKPKNFPALVSWSTVVVKAVGNQPTDGKNVTITDTNASQLVNTYSGNASTGKWSGWRVPNSTTMASKTDVTTAVNTATANAAYENKDNNFTGNLLYKGSEVATVDLLQNFYQADDDNTARQKAESLTTPGFVWFSENDKIPAGTVLSMTGTGYSTDTTTNIGLVDNLLADFSNVPTGIQLNFSSDVWLNTISAKMGTLAGFKITPTTLQIPKNNIYTSSSSNAISLPLPGITSLTYKSTHYTVDKSQANCNIYNNGGVLTFNRILGGFGSGDTTHYYLLSIDSITAY